MHAYASISLIILVAAAFLTVHGRIVTGQMNHSVTHQHICVVVLELVRSELHVLPRAVPHILADHRDPHLF